MNLPTTAQNLKPGQWLQVMRLIHPDNVEETLRILRMHGCLVKTLEEIYSEVPIGTHLKTQVAQLLDEESQHAQHPWPPEPEPEPELEATEPARA